MVSRSFLCALVFLVVSVSAQTTTVAPGANYIISAAIACLQILAGLYLLAFGFRLWKITGAVIGFAFGFLITYQLLAFFLPPIGNSPNNVFFVALGVGLAVGIVTGLLLFCLPLVGLIVAAIIIGIALGFLLYQVAFVYTNFVYAVYISVAICAIGCLVLALILKKPFIIIMTSFYGAFLICFGVAFFAGSFPTQVFSIQTVAPGTAVPFTWQTYVYLAAIIVGAVGGILLQTCLTGKYLKWNDVKERVCPTRQDAFDDGYSTPLVGGKKKKGKKNKKGGDEVYTW